MVGSAVRLLSVSLLLLLALGGFLRPPLRLEGLLPLRLGALQLLEGLPLRLLRLALQGVLLPLQVLQLLLARELLLVLFPLLEVFPLLLARELLLVLLLLALVLQL